MARVCIYIYIHLHVTGEIKTEGELAMEILAYSILAAFDLLLLCIAAIVVVRVRQRMLTTFKSSKHIRVFRVPDNAEGRAFIAYLRAYNRER